MMYTNDSQAISAVLHGDKSSYEMLVEKHKRMVYGIAWSRLGDSDLSEDAAQETFIKAYTYLGTLREPDKFAGWLARIARNVCNSLGRGMKRERAFKERWAVLESAETEPRIDERESLTQQLWDSFADLPALHREALTIFYIEGKSVEEAAAALGITETALKTRLHRARLALRVQLERKLEDSLADLQPSPNFTRSVLVLLPLSPKGAIGAGGALAVFGKLFAGLSFALWMAAASTLPILGLYSLLSRVEESSFEDVPKNKPIKALIRRGYMIAVVGMFVGFAVSWLLMRNVGWMTAMQIFAVLYGCLTVVAMGAALAKRRVGTNTPASIINVAMWGIVFAVLVAISFYHASIVLFAVAILVIGVMSLFVTPRTPQALQHIGINPFIRRALGRGEVPEADLTLDRALNKLELRTFVRLLGTLGIVRDYRFRGDTIYIMLTGMNPHKLAGLGLVAGDSQITVSPDGTCMARISDSDLKAARGVVGPSATAEGLQDEACRAIRYALSCFARGDAQTGIDLLSFKPDQQQSPTVVRNHRVKQLIPVWFGIVVLVQFTSHSAIVMITAAVVGFLVAGLALAITLHINKQQMSSTQDSQKLMRPKESTTMNVTQNKKPIIALLAFTVLVLGLVVAFAMTKCGILATRGQMPAIPQAVVAYPDLEFPPCDNYAKAAFRFWHPADISTIKGVAVLVPGVNGDGRWMAHYPLYKSFAERHGLALVACYFTNPWGGSYCQANMGSGAALLEALRLFAAKSGHPEVENAPLILWGHSAGGQFNYEFACWKPERVIAFIVNKGGCYYTEEPSPETRRVPALFFIGAKDEDFRINNITKFFHGGRDKGALWALAVEPNAGHELGGTRALAMRFFETIIPLRLNTSGKLIALNEAAGWIGDPTTFTISRAQAGGNHTGSWLPSELMAKRWQAFVKQ